MTSVPPEGPSAGVDRDDAVLSRAAPADTVIAAPVNENGGLAPGGPTDGTTDNQLPPTPDGAKPAKKHRWVVEWAVILVIAIVVALVVRTWVAQTFFIPSTSMFPTLKAGDRIVVNKLAFDFGSIKTGEIIVFKRPPAENCGGTPVPDLVKRVIGLPGQTVSAHGGQVYITGKLLPEPWLPQTTKSRIYTTMTNHVKVPKTQYFVMGDNRINSCDSRDWGTVKKTLVVGKVDLIIWPLSRIHFF